MKVTYRMAGLSKLQKAVQLAPAAIASRDAIAIDASLELVKSALEPQIPTGPGHFGYHAKDKIFTRIAAGRRVAGILYTTAPQLRWRETGTAAHVIGERLTGMHRGFMGQSLASGSVVIHHPGEKAQPIFRRTLAALKPTIRGIFVGATQEVIDDLVHESSGSG